MVTFNIYELKNSYINDFGNTARKVTFRRSKAAPEAPDTGGLSLATIIQSGRCGGAGNFFSPRYLEALLTNGNSYQYVLPNKGLMKEAVNALLGLNNVDCVNYVGERWNVIPESLLDDSYARDAVFTLDSSNARISGSFQYQSDLAAIGFTRQQLNVMKFPEEFSDIATDDNCVEDFQQGGICVNSLEGVSPRYFTAIAFGNEDKTKQTSRQIKISASTGQGLLDCANAVATEVVCLRYRGETINDVGRFLTQEEESG